MKTIAVTLTGISFLALIALAFVNLFEIKLVSAQVNASSSPLSSSDTTSTLTLDTQASTTTTQAGASSTSPIPQSSDAATTTTVDGSQATTTGTSLTNTPTERPPFGLTEVHIIGTKYTDYFTDGRTVVSFPGNPKIDGNLDKPNAPIPTHAGLTWDHTTGGYLYDTPSGDLEVGDYALQPNGSYIENAPPFVSSTSTPAQLTASTTNEAVTDTSPSSTSVATPAAPDVSTSSAPAPSDNPATTTSSDSTTFPAI